TTTLPATTTMAPTTTTAKRSTTPALPLGRLVVDQEWTPFAIVGDVVLSHPSPRVERVGFHESNHEGAQQLVPLPAAVSPVALEARQRGTRPYTAADVVMDPDVEVRAPVTGRVKRAGTYVLYCKHSDDYAVIAPDQQPTWEVKILHIDGVRVRAGQRVKAGVTVLAPRATQLPFQSQVDELRTVDPAWPHVHIEVVDPAIRNRPSPNSGC
ncbi:MAG: M23 family metallopeptidase, partial [Actinomycetota bacterium]|nr:M23 family metallopeptidase [Actinomycetota bacterium]